jgi:hypothetical protein
MKISQCVAKAAAVVLPALTLVALASPAQAAEPAAAGTTAAAASTAAGDPATPPKVCIKPLPGPVQQVADRVADRLPPALVQSIGRPKCVNGWQ